MEQHPVPRNISGFQFHLIGDMTLRQFIYLAGGVSIAFIINKALPFPPIINFSISGAVGLTGFAFAFLPIQERPLDKWLISFIKSVLSPTQYLWQKECLPPEILTRFSVTHIKVTRPTHLSLHKEATEKLRLYLATLPVSPHEMINAAEKKYIDKTLSLFNTSKVVINQTPTSVSPATLTHQPVPTQPIPPASRSSFQPGLTQNPAPITSVRPTPVPVLNIQPVQPLPTVPPLPTHRPLQQELTKLTTEKEGLEKELKKLQQELAYANRSQAVRPTVQEEKKEPTIKTVTAQAAISEVGLPYLPHIPNIVLGIIKDPQRKLLPNIILTIKDKSGLPLRALKTNKLGQFATATPLSNGTYFLEIEDPLKRFVFDIAEITLAGKIFLPIEIIAKGEKELMREKLTKELFGRANANI